MKYLLFFLFIAGPAFSQQIDFAKDTINLQELVITNTGKKIKIRTEKFRGPCYSPENMNNASEIVTLVEGLKPGTLHSVSFHFNEMRNAYRSRPETFQDTDFELVLYKVNSDNTPGDKITNEVMIITVRKDHRGRIDVDLSGLNMESPDKLFVGLKRLTDSSNSNDFYIDCLCNGLDKYTSLTRAGDSSPWKRSWVCAALKIDVATAR